MLLGMGPETCANQHSLPVGTVGRSAQWSRGGDAGRQSCGGGHERSRVPRRRDLPARPAP